MNARIVAALKRIVLELVAPTAYHALVRYRYVATDPFDRAVLQIVRQGTGWPSVLPVAKVTGVPGGDGEPKPGAIVLVSFIEGDPSLPMVTHYARTDDNAFVPVSSSLDAEGTVRIGKSADLVKLGSGDETLTPAGAAGRVVRWGDMVAFPGPGPVAAPIAPPGPTNGIARVEA